MMQMVKTRDGSFTMPQEGGRFGGYGFKMPLSKRGLICYLYAIISGGYESLTIPYTEHGIYNAEKQIIGYLYIVFGQTCLQIGGIF